MNKILSKLGLTKIESSIYLALLDEGNLSVSSIAEKTGLYRPQVYKYLPRLIDKNLASESREGKRKTYMAESPRQIQNLIESLKMKHHGLTPVVSGQRS